MTVDSWAYEPTDAELAQYEAAVAEVMAEHGLTEEQARDVLDDWWEDAGPNLPHCECGTIDGHRDVCLCHDPPEYELVACLPAAPWTTVTPNPAYL